jgi:hypothetical protein
MNWTATPTNRSLGLLFVPPDKPIIAGVYANMVSFGTITAGFIVMVFCHRVGHERWQQVGFMVCRLFSCYSTCL